MTFTVGCSEGFTSQCSIRRSWLSKKQREKSCKSQRPHQGSVLTWFSLNCTCCLIVRTLLWSFCVLQVNHCRPVFQKQHDIIIFLFFVLLKHFSVLVAQLHVCSSTSSYRKDFVNKTLFISSTLPLRNGCFCFCCRL